MRIIKYTHQWDYHKVEHILYMEGDKIVGTFDIKYHDGPWYEMTNLYIQPEYRGKGLFHKLMEDVFEECKDFPFFILVTKGLWIIDKYKEYGFEYHSEYDDERFEWMIKINKEK